MAFKSFTHVQSLSKVSKVLVRFAPNDLRAVGTKFVAYLFPEIFQSMKNEKINWKQTVLAELPEKDGPPAPDQKVFRITFLVPSGL